MWHRNRNASARNISMALIASVALFFGACGDDGGDDGQNPGADTGTAFVCDPAGANAAMGALLNAPVHADVEVVVKDPQHPGDPGPQNLP